MKKIGNILWGLVFIVLGVILAGNALGYTNINVFFDGWWTLFIIIPCFIGLFKDNEKVGNLIGLLIGILLFLCCQDYLEFGMIWKLAFPSILVIIGISFIFKDSIGTRINKEIKELNKNSKGANEYCATFSGQNLSFNNEEFKGVDLTAVFGGVKCDLRGAIINEDCVINCSSIFGGIDILVPDNVNIKIKSTPIFGGVSDKSLHGKENAHTIYINATCVFGGVDIK